MVSVEESNHSASQVIGDYTYSISEVAETLIYTRLNMQFNEVEKLPAPVLGSQAQHTIPGTDPTYTYSGSVNDNVITEASAGTNPFYYDDARLYRYRVITDSVLNWDEDPAKFASPGWLSTDRTFSLDDHGYRLYTVRNANGVAAKSQTFRRLPYRELLHFTWITPHSTTAEPYGHPPNDNSSNSGQPLVCYMLERLDSLTTLVTR